MRWSTFDTTSVTAGAAGFVGAGFDGRYLYFVPSYNGTLNGIVMRYDTRAPFGDAASWASFDTTSINASARGFNGGAFDGRYVYFIPHESTNGYNGLLVRYDTQGAFGSAAAWSTFNTTALGAGAVGFTGARFDGRFLYLIPYVTNVMVRYDTQSSFAAVSSWTAFDLSAVSPSAPAFVGGAFDGRFLYLVPLFTATPSGLVLRYDTQAAFAVSSSWSTFDTTTVTANAKGFCGAAFDGRFVYLVPFLSAAGMASGLVTRYDTQAAFATASSWSTFDTTTLAAAAKGFYGATFDGRHIYFAPYSSSTVARYDTTAAFGTAGAWSVFDVAGVNAGAKAFYGAAFDGGAVYFVPHGGSTVARFSAKAPPSMPQLPGFAGSFL
jgi:hypothetical protein